MSKQCASLGQVMNKLWISYEQNKSWTSYEQGMNKLWTSYEQVMNNLELQLPFKSTKIKEPFQVTTFPWGSGCSETKCLGLRSRFYFFFLLSLNIESRPRLFSPESKCQDKTEAFFSLVSMLRWDRDFFSWVSMSKQYLDYIWVSILKRDWDKTRTRPRFFLRLGHWLSKCLLTHSPSSVVTFFPGISVWAALLTLLKKNI